MTNAGIFRNSHPAQLDIMHRDGANLSPSCIKDTLIGSRARQFDLISSIASNTGPSSPGEALITLQHFRGRGLLLQRFGKFARALLFGFEQPHILDCNQRLIGEGLQWLNLSI